MSLVFMFNYFLKFFIVKATVPATNPEVFGVTVNHFSTNFLIFDTQWAYSQFSFTVRTSSISFCSETVKRNHVISIIQHMPAFVTYYAETQDLTPKLSLLKTICHFGRIVK